jgi:hypothetical protein
MAKFYSDWSPLPQLSEHVQAILRAALL